MFQNIITDITHSFCEHTTIAARGIVVSPLVNRLLIFPTGLAPVCCHTERMIHINVVHNDILSPLPVNNKMHRH